ncbi:tpr repeat-containing protein [Lasiosphaeria miniovina]|uniref:Tpr repeat-containing protein n=1 Tax=Lasiosphaeria miniovina TaxID=1954250 RepID=A0AA39ZR26_9PEZI|nr:tpr repeat-containing protein [Lasiosphaeria miniovina]KAK0702012.1 tpr repeat-containing protein [Lasiosphaeria miniovina]
MASRNRDKGLEIPSPTVTPADPSDRGPPSQKESQSPTSPIWQAAIEKYYSELAKGGVKASLINKDLWNIQGPDELIAQIEALAPVQSVRSNAWTKALTQLGPILLGINDFATIIAWGMGMNGKVAAILWGSIRLIVKFAQPVLPDIIEMLESLQHALPRMHMYERELPMTEALEKAMFDMYSEIIVFCAHAIAFFRNNPNVSRNRHAWSQFSRDFAEVIINVQRYSRRVDEAADMIRLSRETHTAETVAALNKDLADLQINQDGPSQGAKLPCFMIPFGLNLRFLGRDEEMRRMREALDPPDEANEGTSPKLRAIGIHGLGGVGKSQLALHYANTSMERYEIIAWISAETQIKLVQTLSGLANKLGLVEGSGEDDYQNVQRVRDWLNSAKKPFLLIFDNVDKIELLDQIWPASNKGSIIITTRSPSQASKRTTITLAVESFSAETRTNVLKSLTGMEPMGQEEVAAAAEICRLVGGLPLAMVQISDFIRDRGYSYGEFLKVYEKSAERVFAKSERPVEYDHTLLTTFEISLQKLSEEAASLANLLACFDPDLIPERLLTETKAEMDGTDFEFLSDDFDFGDAVAELTRTSMVNRLTSSKALSMHRLVQFAVFVRLSKADRIKYFDLAVNILYFDFPNTWQVRGAHQGHGWASWETCSAILPHVGWLMALSEKHEVKSGNTTMWAELVFRAGTYLWEKELPSQALSFFEFGLRIDDGLSGSIAAQAHRLLGHISLDLSQPRAGLAAYEQALALREKLEAPESPPIADVCDSIACAYTEAGNVESAFSYLERATAIHNAYDPSKMSRTLAIRAMTCLRASQAEEALDAIRACWGLQKMTQEQIEASRYPKHSGDIMLLARIYRLQGKKAEARELASRTITMRRGVYGEKGGPRVADSLFTVARMLHEEGEPTLAARLLREVMEISGDAPSMRTHLARALWFLAGIEDDITKVSKELREGSGTTQNSTEEKLTGPEDMRERAKAVRNSIEDREWADEDSDEGFMRLVSWMLW